MDALTTASSTLCNVEVGEMSMVCVYLLLFFTAVHVSAPPRARFRVLSSASHSSSINTRSRSKADALEGSKETTKVSIGKRFVCKCLVILLNAAPPVAEKRLVAASRDELAQVHLPPHTTHNTQHNSRLTRHTPHATRHTPHATRHLTS